jgi:hypothetical protein
MIMYTFIFKSIRIERGGRSAEWIQLDFNPQYTN